MTQAHRLLRHARQEAGLTQAELAARLGKQQASIARLEAPGANPTLATLDRALRATGRRLELMAVRHVADVGDVDEDQIRRQLELSPAERVRAHDAAYENVRSMLAETTLLDDDVG